MADNERPTSYIRFNGQAVYIELGMSSKAESPIVITPLINNTNTNGINTIVNSVYNRGLTPESWSINLVFKPDDDGLANYNFCKSLNDNGNEFDLLTSEPAIETGIYIFSEFTTTIKDVAFYGVSATINYLRPLTSPSEDIESSGALFARKIRSLESVNLSIGSVYEGILYLKRFLVMLGVYSSDFPNNLPNGIYDEILVNSVFQLITTTVNYPYFVDKITPSQNINTMFIEWIAAKAANYDGVFNY